MITTTILNLFYSAIAFIVSPLLNAANVTINANVTSAITSGGNYAHFIYGVIPGTLTALFSAFGVIVITDGAIFGYKIIKWIYNKIPGIS